MNKKVNKNKKKQEVFFIATKYKNKPANIQFYTKSGKHVKEKSVEKKETNKGLRFFASA